MKRKVSDSPIKPCKKQKVDESEIVQNNYFSNFLNRKACSVGTIC